MLGLDGRLKSKKEIEGLNKVPKKSPKNESYSWCLGDAGQERGWNGAEDHWEGNDNETFVNDYFNLGRQHDEDIIKMQMAETMKVNKLFTSR